MKCTKCGMDSEAEVYGEYPCPVCGMPTLHGDKRNTDDWTFPCCKDQLLPESLYGVAMATCPCGLSYDPKVIIAYNEMVKIITDWRDVVNGKALIRAEVGQEHFIAELCRRGLKYAR
jgi:hypothetical protein